ncbi:MAG: Ig-like domain-containing protein [Moraxellaceae bacterium]|nr:Ig-like domain-containing protein [Moraxellaceae bacterium]
MRYLAVLLTAVLLTACGGGGTRQTPVLPDFPDGSGNINPSQRGLVYMYPAIDQVEVSTLAPLALRFSHPIDVDGIDYSDPAAITLVKSYFDIVEDATNVVFPKNNYELTIVDEGFGLFIRLKDNVSLKPGTTYRIQSNNVTAPSNPINKGFKLNTGDPDQAYIRLPKPTFPKLKFTTRAALNGSIAAQSSACTTAVCDFKLLRSFPDPNSFLIDSFPFLTFSTIRLQFSQPIDPKSINYSSGASGTVRLIAPAGIDAGLVPARVLVNGNKLVIDPLESLLPGVSYSLDVSGLKSIFGNSLAGFSPMTITPTANGELKSVKIFVANTELDKNFNEILDPVTGQPIPSVSKLAGIVANKVPVESDILGRGKSAPAPQAAGELVSQMVFTPVRDVIPIRVAAGSELTSGSLKVVLGGENDPDKPGVEANLATGTLSIKLISDATGLLLPNKYNGSLEAPRLVNLIMDVAVSAANPTANGDFTQDVLHVEVNGIARFLPNNKLEIDAIGVVELKILGVDNAIGVLNLKLLSNLETPGPQAPNKVTPFIQSWVPGATVNLDETQGVALVFGGGDLIRPGDALAVNFGSIMDANSARLPNAVRVFKGDTVGAVTTLVPDTSARFDGATLVINAALEHGKFYRIDLDPTQIKDLAGCPLAMMGDACAPVPAGSDPIDLSSLTFSIPKLVATPATVRPPVALSVYPGYPCPIAEGSRELAGPQSAWRQGRCRGGKASDDRLPMPVIEQSRDIKVAFSQSIAPQSVALATQCNGAASIRVERVDASGNCLGVVPGKLIVKPREVQFTPNQSWQVGQLYRYVLGSNNDMRSSAANCLGQQAICGVNGLPLQTQLISQNYDDVAEPKRGGPPIEIFFVGGTDKSGANTALRVLPVTDVDANFTFEPGSSPTNGENWARKSDGTACSPGTVGAANNDATPGACIMPNGALLQPNTVDGPSFGGAATSFALGCRIGTQSEGQPQGANCQGNQFLLITAALGAKLGELVPDTASDRVNDFKVKVEIDPAIVITSGADIYATLGVTPEANPLVGTLYGALCNIPLLGQPLCAGIQSGSALVNGLLPITVPQPLKTGPLVFRIRYPDDSGSPILGFIRSVPNPKAGQPGETDTIPELEATLNLYTDIPELNAIASALGIEAIPINNDAKSNTDLSAKTPEMRPGFGGTDCSGTSGANRGSGSIVVTGKVNFLPDGRLTVSLKNKEPVKLTACLDALGGLIGGYLKVIVPSERFVIDASLAPIKQ